MSEVERYYFKYEPNSALRSEWVAHYLIYSMLLHWASPVPTLDLCCGCGAGTKMLATKLSSPVAGIDYSSEAIQYADDNNSHRFTEYLKLDLNRLQTLFQFIRTRNIKQVFLVEAIEHLALPDQAIETILCAGVTKILISTPFEEVGTKSSGFHISPFTPKTHALFTAKWNAQTLGFCRHVDRKTILELADSGKNDAVIINSYFEKDHTGPSGNYLMEITR